MYSEHQPNPILAPYIDKYWEFKGYPEYGMRIHILPDGCTDFIFTLGDATQSVKGDLVMQPCRSYFIGPMNTYSELVAYTETVHMMGVRFLPCGLARFMELPLPELANQRQHARDLTKLLDDSWAERLCEKKTFQERVDFLETMFIAYLYKCDRLADQAVVYSVDQIDRFQGKLPIRSLMENVCLCQRQFERKFKRDTGFTPKEYSRIVKFRRAVDLLRVASCGDLLTVAVEAGYYDVPHLSREVRQLSGNVPCSFLSLSSEQEVTLTYIES